MVGRTKAKTPKRSKAAKAQKTAWVKRHAKSDDHLWDEPASVDILNTTDTTSSELPIESIWCNECDTNIDVSNVCEHFVVEDIEGEPTESENGSASTFEEILIGKIQNMPALWDSRQNKKSGDLEIALLDAIKTLPAPVTIAAPTSGPL
ncbi:hypothetical protein FQR65_LT17049 [Abscondita terminalis]|nr:hypothetical protein FQR65_LT17049 [Abscondita terminalis]